MLQWLGLSKYSVEKLRRLEGPPSWVGRTLVHQELADKKRASCLGYRPLRQVRRHQLQAETMASVSGAAHFGLSRTTHNRPLPLGEPSTGHFIIRLLLVHSNLDPSKNKGFLFVCVKKSEMPESTTEAVVYDVTGMNTGTADAQHVKKNQHCKHT